MDRSKSLVNAADLETMVANIFTRAGFRDADARLVAQALVWADLRGHGSHGVARVKRYLEFIRRGDLDPDAQPDIVKNLGALIQVDGRKAAGPVAATLAMEAAIAGARRHGAAWVLVGHTTHAGPLGFYMERMAQAGLIGLAFAAGSPLMAYYGAANPSVSTSPIAIGIPGPGDFAYVIDMATSVAANGKLQEAARSNVPIPLGWALDASGRPTADPKEAACLLPVGGPKGAGLSLAFEMICSVGSGAPILQTALRGPAPHVQNAAFCAINIGQIYDLDAFRGEIDDLIKLMKDQPRADGFAEILMPGERAARSAAVRRRDGIPLADKLLRELQDLERADAG
jgi:ureidoglycolate dehydrogenase (NAD+)